MRYLLFIALGGASGAVARYLMSGLVNQVFSGRWPAGTLMVNMAGSFCIGVVFVLLEKAVLHPDWRSVLMVGFLGAFTTFSTFSLDTYELLEHGLVFQALGYVAASVVLCVLMAGLSIYLTRAVL